VSTINLNVQSSQVLETHPAFSKDSESISATVSSGDAISEVLDSVADMEAREVGLRLFRTAVDAECVV